MEIDKEMLIEKIKEKKEYRHLPYKFVELFLNKVKTKNKKEREIIKEVRALLRKAYSAFKDELKKKELEKCNTKQDVTKLLKKHKSTRERLPYYEEIYKKIFSITGKPKIILDLGAGLNPLSYFFLNFKPIYYASELTEYDAKLIDEFFKKFNINGFAFKFDLLNDDFTKLPKADICFLFKVLESLELAKKNVSEEILKKIPAKYIVVSFAKLSLSGKEIKKKGRAWLRRILKKLGYSYKVFDIGNEIFFVIDKNQKN